MRAQRHVTIILLVRVSFLVSAILLFDPYSAQAAPGRVDVIVEFANTPGQAEQALVRGMGADIRHTFHLIPAISISIPEEAVSALLNSPNIVAIEPNTIGHIQIHPVGDNELLAAWGVGHIGAGRVHDRGNKETGVKVAVIDTGLDFDHNDLNDNYMGGYDFYNNDSDPMDDHGHGTHVAGTIGAEDNGFGVVGVAPEAHLYALKVCNEYGECPKDKTIAALEWAVDNGIQVANMSLGYDTGGSVFRTACDNARDAGILLVAAAGNRGGDCLYQDTVLFPARFGSVMAIAATNVDDTRPLWSGVSKKAQNYLDSFPGFWPS